jgi:ATP-dependent exoDNAse (exonuclease V) beta subunit
MNGVDARSVEEGRQLARWLRALGPAGLGATSWSGVAILCPRTRWLQSLAVGLREEGLGPQIHSERAVQADDPVYAWFTALLHVLACPDDGFEVVGVLREIYGWSDEALAHHAAGRPQPWSLQAEAPATGAADDPPAPDGIAATLRFLRDLRLEILPLPLRDAARRAVEAVALRERLQILALPELAVDETLETLLVRAAQAESDGCSLAEFAEQLQDGMADAVPARPVVRDAVQLLTCHKAKGLQWEAVVLPLLFRTIGEPNEYPVVIRSGTGSAPQVALSSHDLQPMQDRVEQRRRQELQRLLYVALTRAQRTLVLVDDDRLFPRRKPNRSCADLLGLLGEDGSRLFNPSWNSLPEQLRAGAAPAAAEPVEGLPEREPLTEVQVRQAVQHAGSAPRRILPYQLGEAEARAELSLGAPERERTAGAEAARAYGIWWHEAVERIDWSAPAETRQRAWIAALAGCPDEARGQREGRQLMASATAARLAQSGWRVRCEVPILWRRGPAECVEGIVDVIAYDPARRRWLVADWKTNLIEPGHEEHLRRIYEPQLRAYAEALQALTRQPVEAGVYSTCTGAWIPCADLA